MPLAFFEKQKIDEIGVDAVHLEKVIVRIWAVSLLSLICNIIFGIFADTWSFNFASFFILWLILFIGFLGAVKRSSGTLLAYIILMVLIAIGYIILIVFTIVYIVYFVTECWPSDESGDSLNCENYDKESVMLVSSALSIGTLFMVVFWLMQIWSIRFALRVRHKLNSSYTQYVVISQQQPMVTGVYPPLQTHQHPTMGVGSYQSNV